METLKSALVVEGGAMRGVFSTGVLDSFIKEGFNPFDLHIGVSAGATNLAAYLANMYQRNYNVYTDYSLRPEFISWKKFLKGGHLLDLDWLWDITIKEIRLDLEHIIAHPGYYVGVTDVKTGKAVYIKPDIHNLEQVIKASSSVPIFYRDFVSVNGIEYVDGGLADPIPVIEAYKRKARKIMVIRSRPLSYTMKEGNPWVTKIFLRKYPKLKEAMLRRAKTYQEAIDFMRNPPEDVKIIEVNPHEGFKTKRLTKDIVVLNEDYEVGYNKGLDVIREWNQI
jgi:predicted patatin/cPLA2 family phospholipase